MNPTDLSTLATGSTPCLPQGGLEPAITQGHDDWQVGSVTGLTPSTVSAPHSIPPDQNSPQQPPPPDLDEMGHIKIGSLNIKGANSPSTQNKWKKIIHSSSQKKLAILCTVESHTDDKQIKALNQTYNPKFTFIHTHDEEKPKTKGITIVTNTHITKCPPTDIHPIVPGCAIQFTIHWPQNSHTKIMAIYAPNSPRENRDFWNKLVS